MKTFKQGPALFRPVAAGRRGFYLIGMLIALAIIFTLVGRGFLGKDPVTQTRQAEVYIDRSKDATCLADLNVLKFDMTQLIIGSGGMLPEVDRVRQKAGTKRCPGEGIYQVDGQGNVYCTEHAPVAPGVQVMDLYER